MKFGIIKEGKTPPDKRVPLSPRQCKILLDTYPDMEIFVQPSNIRAFKDSEYEALGISLQEDLTDCDVLMGVKEVRIQDLIPHKTYLFFSHTYKKQPYNRELLNAILDKKIRLIDYEMLKEPGGKRVLGFGRYAGIVGAYNAFRAWGEMTESYILKAAHECEDRREMESELIKVKLPKDTKIAITGAGRVGGGAMEVLSALKITHVFPKEYAEQNYPEPVFTQLDVRQYFKRKDGQEFKRADFYSDPSGYESAFMEYASITDIYIPCHFWSDKSPYIFTRDDAKSENFKIKLVSDISCDIDGPIASTLRPSEIADPFFGYDPINEKEVPLGTKGSIGVSAVDNLPCELPKDASEDFGNELIKNVIPNFFNGDKDKILDKASETTLDGKLNSHFQYLENYTKGLE
jgi:hypothetical protein